MTLPDALLTLAMVGTDKGASMSAPDPDGALGALLNRVSQRGEVPLEGRLLLTAAGIDLRARAGWLPPLDSRPAPAAPPPDSRPACTPRAGRFLIDMLRGTHPEVLPEWLQTAATRGVRPPAESLPLLLERGRTDKPLRQAILPVLGERGLWLAEVATVKGWHWFAPQDVEHTWEQGEKVERLALIELLRQSDPDRARALVEHTWKEERAADRADLLTLFQGGLSMADEPFLEAALDDRGQEVRQIAARWLAYLPESRFAQRMIARFKAFVTIDKPSAGQPTVIYSMPTKLDESMKRDGLARPTSETGVGVGAYALQRLMSCTPPSAWREHLCATNADLLDMLRPRGESQFDGGALVWAAHYARDVELARLLLAMPEFSVDHTLQVLLLDLLPPAEADAVLTGVFRQHPRAAYGLEHPAHVLLKHHAHPWSHDLTHEFLHSLRRYLTSKSDADHVLRLVLRGFALRFPVDLSAEIMSVLRVERKDNPYHYMPDAILEVQSLLDFRREMHQAF
jgi:hypothetical protein